MKSEEQLKLDERRLSTPLKLGRKPGLIYPVRRQGKS